MEKRILVIDDVRSFPVLHDNADVTYARTTVRAIELMEAFKFDEVWFDHDMSWENWDDTTVPAALWFVENNYAAKVYIHTANYDGRVRLTGIFQQVGIFPEQRWVTQMDHWEYDGSDGLPYQLETSEQFWGDNLQYDVERKLDGKSLIIR